MASRLRHSLRRYSTILSPNSSTPLTAKEKSRTALHLLKSETNPERILDICRAASLTPDFHLDRIALSVAISKLKDGNHFSTIDQFLRDLPTSRPDLHNERFLSQSIVLYGQARMLPNAVTAFTRMRDEFQITPSVKSLNALLFAALIAKDYKEVSRIYLDFPKNYSIQPDVETYNTVIKSFAESGSTSSVYSILSEMDRNSVRPNAVTFSNAIEGFYSEKKFEEVGKVLKMMEEKYGMSPALSTYNVRILSLCKLKRTSEAKALLQGMISGGRKPNWVSFSHLIHGYCWEGNLDEAKKVFADMKKRGYKPESPCYFTLAHFLCEGGDFESAFEITKESMDKGWVPNFTTMKKLVTGLVGVSKTDDAKELIKQVKEKFTESSDKWDEIEAELIK
ncbi:pentatricopeptide repeat-containing protein At1g61870, mitochondrial [Lotus japonicus]|uniref:pentatricopeptide repeat-containing protein At1g61870, mitochondrial n=1 Tax=Lotus japonicus TaxID=34305 RepID=UPI002583E6E7|nr:pentatricopeptide repeat-containing protein At1g61870, mitochondrial [Lotus japonicus]